MRGSLNEINDGQRIHPAAAALVDAFLEEKGIGIGVCRRIGENGDRCAPGLDRPLFRCGSGRQFQSG